MKHGHGPVVPRHRQLDVVEPLAGAEAAAGGRERCEERNRDRRAGAPHGSAAAAGPADADRDLVGRDVLAVGVGQHGRHESVTVAVPSAPVGALAPVTVTPAAGVFFPLSS